MSVLTTILSPPFLANNIELIAFVTSVMILVIFDDFVFARTVFPFVDFIKYELSKGIEGIYEKKGIKSLWAKYAKRYSIEALATVLIVTYCYLGYEILGVYFIEPILQRWKSVILLVVIALFIMANYLINNPKMRKRFFGVYVYNPEKKK